MNVPEYTVILAHRDAGSLRDIALRAEALCPENGYLLFTDGDAAAEYLSHERADMLLTDSFPLTERVQELQPWMKLVLISDRDGDAVEAMSRRLDGFILSPVTDGKLVAVLKMLK